MIPDDSVFCEFCGVKQDERLLQPNGDLRTNENYQSSTTYVQKPPPVVQSNVNNENHQNHMSVPKSRKKLFKIIGSIAAAILLFIIIGISVIYLSQTGYGKVEDCNGNEPELNGMYIEPQKIYDDNNLVIYATGISYNEYGDWYKVYFYIESRNINKIWLNSDDVYINNNPDDKNIVTNLISTIHGKSYAKYLNDYMIIHVPELHDEGIYQIDTISFGLTERRYGILGWYKGRSRITDSVTIKVSHH